MTTALKTEFDNAMNTWQNDVQTAAQNPGLTEAADASRSRVDTSLRNWRSYVNRKITSASGNAPDPVSILAARVAEERETLRKLREQQGTGTEQAISLNPKVVPSPYVNILNLRRNFRYNTKVGIIVATVIFGILALGSVGFLVYRIVSDVSTGGSFINPSPILHSGGARRRLRFHDEL